MVTGLRWGGDGMEDRGLGGEGRGRPTLTGHGFQMALAWPLPSKSYLNPLPHPTPNTHHPRGCISEGQQAAGAALLEAPWQEDKEE